MPKAFVMPKAILSFFIFHFAFLISPVAQLLPHIGLDELPANDEPICELPLYDANYQNVGYDDGTFVADFTLFDINSEDFTLSQELENGLPVLLISSSYTCPVFRGKIGLINQLVSEYGDQIRIAVIYTVEAHPDEDISPYFGYVNPGSANQQQGVLYNQPTTYGERLDILNDLLEAQTIDFDIYVDGPCNAWLENYGPAPNMAYLLNTDGTVYTKHGWFDKYPDDIGCDIETMLDPDYDCPEDVSGFYQMMVNDSIAYGDPFETIYAYATLQNNSNAPVLIEVERVDLGLPQGWASSMCLDICLQTNETYTEVLLEPDEQITYTNYFYTSETEGLGTATIQFRNSQISQNQHEFTFYGQVGTVGIENEKWKIENGLDVFPNPTSDIVSVLGGTPDLIVLFALNGIKVLEESGTSWIDTSALPSGLYLMEVRLAGVIERFQLIVN